MIEYIPRWIRQTSGGWRRIDFVSGANIVPLICGSEETQLTDFSSDKRAWPINLTIGNVQSSIQNKLSYLVRIVLAFLPVPPEVEWNYTSDERAQSDTNQQVLSDIGKILQEAVTWVPKEGDTDSGALWPRSDSTMCPYCPIVTSWLADHMERVNLMRVRYNALTKCHTQNDELGSHILLLDMDSPQRKSAVFRQNHWEYQHAKTASDHQAPKITEQWFEFVGARPVLCIFWDLPHVIAYDLHWPEIIQYIFMAMYDHRMTRIKWFLQGHGKATVSDEFSAGIPPHPNFHHWGKDYRQILQWSGKEMEHFGQIINPASTTALHYPLPHHRAVFQGALTRSGSLVYWSFVVQYRTHITKTLNYLWTISSNSMQLSTLLPPTRRQRPQTASHMHACRT